MALGKINFAIIQFGVYNVGMGIPQKFIEGAGNGGYCNQSAGGIFGR